MVSYFDDTRLKNFKHATTRYKQEDKHHISIDEDAYHILCEAKERLRKNNLPSSDTDAIIYLAMSINSLLKKLEEKQINLDDWI